MMCFGSKQDESAVAAMQRTSEIDKMIRVDKSKTERQIKILLLGAGESGKSTVLKQMRLIHAGGFSPDERLQWRTVIFDNLVSAFDKVFTAMYELDVRADDITVENGMEDSPDLDGTLSYDERRRSITLGDPANKKHFNLLKQKPQIANDEPMPQSCFEAFTALWNDSAVQETIQKGNEFALLDNLNYFCTDLPRFFAPDYIPTDQDILRARLRTTGIIETVFDISPWTYRMFDVGGQRSERRKWINAFDGVNMVLFLVAISGYDQVVSEDHASNQMVESLKIFEDISNSPYFVNSSIILFLNKMDIFAEKVMSDENPIAKYFPDFRGKPHDVKAGKEYFADRFRILAPRDKTIYIHYTNATDTDLLKRTMDSVQDTVLQKSINLMLGV